MRKLVIASIRKRAANLLRKGRADSGFSLRATCQNLPVNISASSLSYIERYGPSVEALRALVLFRHYSLNLTDLLDYAPEGTDPEAYAQRDVIAHLNKDRNFAQICRYLYTLKPKTRKKMIAALSTFLQSWDKS